ncbi:HNH endonuclease [Pedobacter rhizosphaerae]|uniref:HNH endonuclease n=1 Tax=Pedobacter rhizosphaerae TaxID=390241 RepID=A0A1H9L8Y2_9SPHI|nr:hypothetical protein [Pedobacter rhizosphaerae]SER07758.1 hypothetical protein SAMN04488023_10443 [Pedobacter rhizosphaerae]
MGIYRRYISLKDPQKTEEQIIKVHGSYGALLFDRRWKDKRLSILERDNKRCVICDFNENLQVHHRQYHYIEMSKKFKVPWDYPDKLLITLCNSCHQRGHSQYKVPIIHI